LAVRSKVTALPAPLKATVDRLLSSGRHTLDEINEHLKKLADAEGVPAEDLPSRSSLGRYATNFDKVAGKMREAREVAAGILDKFGAEPEGDVSRLLMELLKTVTFQALGEAAEHGSDAKDIMFLSQAIKNAIGSGKLHAEERATIRRVAADEARAATIVETEQAVEKARTAKGVSEDAYHALRNILAGLKAGSGNEAKP